MSAPDRTALVLLAAIIAVLLAPYAHLLVGGS